MITSLQKSNILSRNSRSNSSGTFPYQIFSAPQRKKTWAPNARDSSRYSTPSFVLTNQILSKSPSSNLLVNQPIEPINKFGTTKYKLFEMNKLRMECNELLKIDKDVTKQMASRNMPSKSLVDPKRIARDCITERSGPKNTNNQISENFAFRKNLNLYKNDDALMQNNEHCLTSESTTITKNEPFHSNIKLPNISKGNVQRYSAPKIYKNLVHPKAVSVIKGQPIFSIRKKAIIQNENPFEGVKNDELIHPKDAEEIKKKLHFLNRAAAKNLPISGTNSPTKSLHENCDLIKKCYTESGANEDFDEMTFGGFFTNLE